MPERARTGVESQSALAEALALARSQVNEIIVDKAEVIDLAFSALLAGGHLLIEDLPGVGKTTLAHALSLAIGGSLQRIQFTSDMLPADILGVSIYRRDEERFEFRPGPIFANVVLADEINRATPRTQSALLEAMAVGVLSIGSTVGGIPEVLEDECLFKPNSVSAIQEKIVTFMNDEELAREQRRLQEEKIAMIHEHYSGSKVIGQFLKSFIDEKVAS